MATMIVYAIVLVSCAIVLVILDTVRRAVKSPLRQIPGPWYAQYTHLFLKYNVICGRRIHYIHSLHEKYGHVVRTGPEEVDFSDFQSFKEIHRIGGRFLKSPWYQKFRDAPVLDTFSMLDPKQHAARRKLLARPFSNTSLRENWEQVVCQKSNLVVSKIKQDAMNGNADVFNWWTLMATDIITQIAFGGDPQMVQLGKKTREVEDLDAVIKLGGVRAELPAVYDLIRLIPLRATREVLEATDRVMEYDWKAVRNARQQSLGQHNIFGGILSQSQKGDGKMTDMDVNVEASGLIVAGSGTTAVTLTYLIYAVLQRPEVQEALEAEVRDSLSDDFGDTELEKLPTLNATIDETLRLYGAAPGSLPRIVPAGGAQLGGYYLPAGTTLCTQSFSIHRNPDNFADPNRFDYTRFLPEQTKEREQAAFNAFGAGSRTCLGVHIARMEMRYAVAHFFRLCAGARLASSTTSESMEMLNFFLISPKSGKCEVTLAH